MEVELQTVVSRHITFRKEREALENMPGKRDKRACIFTHGLILRKETQKYVH